jgi:hypothetical protein
LAGKRTSGALLAAHCGDDATVEMGAAACGADVEHAISDAAAAANAVVSVADLRIEMSFPFVQVIAQRAITAEA